jgi:hypothetical protein
MVIEEVEKTMVKEKILAVSLLVILLLFVFTTGLTVVTPIIKIANAGDVTSYYNNISFLSLTTPIPEQQPPGPGPSPGPGPQVRETKPIIYWYDFQNATGVSKLNSQIDVNQEYKFCICIRSDQGWDDINFIDITAWFDNGDESTVYNDSANLGGNLNMFLRYENITGVANFKLLWPDDEVTKGSFTEKDETVSNGSSNNTECHNLTFSFIPGYQFRYAPGDGSWDYTTNAYNDIWSWKFKISVTDSGEDASGPSTVCVIDEFGVYSYTEIVSTGISTIQGRPGENATTDSRLTINTRSNLDYYLSVDIDKFKHETNPTANISNQTMWVSGGDLINFTNFMGSGPIYLYGSSTAYVDADDNNTTKTTDNLDYKCDIPLAQLPGNYTSTIYYKLRTKS